ncbi:hypothetical protein [Halorubrum sp. DTA98]|uniref:hypothetical protein n=1 Tax=Halorubrum sp. DTA98 TaxID=3402163 RepID=UPI003AB08FE8
MTATRDSAPSRLESGEGQPTTIAQLDDVLDLLEGVDWSAVDGMTTAEAAALTERLTEARERTQARPDGGASTKADTAFDARDVRAGDLDDATVRQATEGGR